MSVRSLALALLMAGMLAIPSVRAGGLLGDDGESEEAKWEELELVLPKLAKEEDFLPIYVSAAAVNRFFVDPASVSVGSDGVVRYTLLIATPGGVKNLSYEGMRCLTRERRVLAIGRGDGTWSLAKGKQWEKIREGGVNRYHAALFQEYFCPGGVIVRNADEAIQALRRGGPLPFIN